MAQRTQGNTYLHLLVYYIIKDTGDQPDEDIHRVRSGRAPSFCPCAGGDVYLWLRLWSSLERSCSSVLRCFWIFWMVFTQYSNRGNMHTYKSIYLIWIYTPKGQCCGNLQKNDSIVSICGANLAALGNAWNYGLWVRQIYEDSNPVSPPS